MLRMIRIVITQNIGKCKYQLAIHTNLEHITILAYIQYAQEDNEYAPWTISLYQYLFRLQGVYLSIETFFSCVFFLHLAGTTTVACSMAVDDQDQEINKLLDALGFEKSVCHIRQNMVAAQELTKNACLDSEFSCIYTGSLAEGFSGNYYSKISRADFDFMLIFNRFPYIVDEDKTRDDAPKLPLVARVCHDSVRQGYAKLELINVQVPSI